MKRKKPDGGQPGRAPDEGPAAARQPAAEPPASTKTQSTTTGRAQDLPERRVAELGSRKLLATVQEEKEKLQALLNAITDEVWFADRNGNFTLANDAARREFLLGDAREVSVRDLTASLEVLRPDGSPRPVEEAPSLRALAGEVVSNQEEIARTPASGELRHRLVSAFPVRGAAGGILGSVSVVRDITRRRTAEETLQRLHQQNELILDSAAEGILGLDLNGNHTFVNQAAARMLGYSSEELLGRPSHSLWHHTRADGRPYPAEECSIYAAYRDGVVHQISNEVFWRKDGTSFAVEYASTPIRDRDRIVGAVVTFADITERRLAETALRKSEARLREAQRVAKVGSWEQDLATGAVIWSESLYRMVGRDPVLPTPSYEDLPNYYTPESWARLSAAVQVALATGTGFELDLEVIREDGTHWWQTARGEAVRSPSGEIDRLQGTVLDITDSKSAQEAKERLQEQLNQAQKLDSIGRLAGGIAHDFNNMLGVILGYSELALMQMRPDEPLRKDLEEVQNAAKRSASLTRQLLAFARKQFVSPRLLDLNVAVDAMLKMLRRLIGEDVELDWKPGQALWSVRMDPGQIDQLLANLCLNARDAITVAGSSGRITVATSNVTLDKQYCATHPGSSPGDYASLQVTDNGCGMDEETKARIFEPFFTTKNVGEGTGLGLATVYGIVKQNGGFIRFDSERGKGTTFSLYLPKAVPESERPPDERGTTSGPGTETILVVDDEVAVGKAVGTILESLGYQVLSASTPGEAIRMAKQHPGEIHLLFTDLVMPLMSGWDLAVELQGRYPKLKCLFMSGYTGEVIAKHLVQSKGVRFIQKPFTRQAVAEKVRQALRGEPVEG